mmetsp:Transcript_41051/g.103087  ORF Transcript_41051/g.103087 Transcript_41051/m.103087 type:complete len:319 (-) Transcript_41051:1175-2131(-)
MESRPSRLSIPIFAMTFFEFAACWAWASSSFSCSSKSCFCMSLSFFNSSTDLFHSSSEVLSKYAVSCSAPLASTPLTVATCLCFEMTSFSSMSASSFSKRSRAAATRFSRFASPRQARRIGCKRAVSWPSVMRPTKALDLNFIVGAKHSRVFSTSLRSLVASSANCEAVMSLPILCSVLHLQLAWQFWIEATSLAAWITARFSSACITGVSWEDSQTSCVDVPSSAPSRALRTTATSFASICRACEMVSNWFFVTSGICSMMWPTTDCSSTAKSSSFIGRGTPLSSKMSRAADRACRRSQSLATLDCTIRKYQSSRNC